MYVVRMVCIVGEFWFLARTGKGANLIWANLGYVVFIYLWDSKCMRFDSIQRVNR